MADDQSNCMGIRRPSLFIAILDFIVCLVLAIGILQVSYTQNAPIIKKKEKIGRITVIAMLIARFITSAVSEYIREKFLRDHFVDKRETFKLFAITRYFFLIGVLMPVMLASAMFLYFKGTMIAIISSILVFQELVIFVMIVFKIWNARIPIKLKFIDKKYGAEIDRRIHMIQSNLQSIQKLNTSLQNNFSTIQSSPRGLIKFKGGKRIDSYLRNQQGPFQNLAESNLKLHDGSSPQPELVSIPSSAMHKRLGNPFERVSNMNGPPNSFNENRHLRQLIQNRTNIRLYSNNQGQVIADTVQAKNIPMLTDLLTPQQLLYQESPVDISDQGNNDNKNYQMMSDCFSQGTFEGLVNKNLQRERSESILNQMKEDNNAYLEELKINDGNNYYNPTNSNLMPFKRPKIQKSFVRPLIQQESQQLQVRKQSENEQMQQVLMSFQNDESFFDQRRDRIQSEQIRVSSRPEYPNTLLYNNNYHLRRVKGKPAYIAHGPDSIETYNIKSLKKIAEEQSSKRNMSHYSDLQPVVEENYEQTVVKRMRANTDNHKALHDVRQSFQ